MSKCQSKLLKFLLSISNFFWPGGQGGFLGGSAGKESTCNAGDLGSIPGLERSPGEGNDYPFWPGEFHGLYSPWGRKESDMAEIFTFTSFPVLEPENCYSYLSFRWTSENPSGSQNWRAQIKKIAAMPTCWWGPEGRWTPRNRGLWRSRSKAWLLFVL